MEKFDADHVQKVPKESKGVTEREVADIEERAQPSTPVIYEVVRQLGEEEMARPAVSLWWPWCGSSQAPIPPSFMR